VTAALFTDTIKNAPCIRNKIMVILQFQKKKTVSLVIDKQIKALVFKTGPRREG